MMLSLTPLEGIPWRKPKSGWWPWVSPYSHSPSGKQGPQPPLSPLTILQVFSQLDHTKEQSGSSCLSQGKYSNDCLSSPFTRLYVDKHRCRHNNLFELCIEYAKEQQWSQGSIHCLHQESYLRDHTRGRKTPTICLLNTSTEKKNTWREKHFFKKTTR